MNERLLLTPTRHWVSASSHRPSLLPVTHSNCSSGRGTERQVFPLRAAQDELLHVPLVRAGQRPGSRKQERWRRLEAMESEGENVQP